jgi:hypothetical protein
VLDQSRGSFFAWMADDDFRTPDFLQLSLDLLLCNPDFIGAACPNVLSQKGKIVSEVSNFSLSGTRLQRYKDFFKYSYKSHGLFYSLWRCDSLKKCSWIGKKFYGWDWAVVLFLANEGKIGRTNSGLYTFGLEGISSDKNFDSLKFHGLVGITRFFPFLNFSIKIISLTIFWKPWDFLNVLFLLFKLNTKSLVEQAESHVYIKLKLLKKLIFKIRDN